MLSLENQTKALGKPEAVVGKSGYRIVEHCFQSVHIIQLYLSYGESGAYGVFTMLFSVLDHR